MCIERDDMRKGRDRDDLDLPFESYKIVGVVKDGRRIIPAVPSTRLPLIFNNFDHPKQY